MHMERIKMSKRKSTPERLQFVLTVSDPKSLRLVVADLKDEIKAIGATSVINYLLADFLEKVADGKADEILEKIVDSVRNGDGRLKGENK